MPVTLHATCYMTPRRASEKHQTSFVSVVCNISIDTAHGTIHTTTVYTKHFRVWGCGEAGDKSSAGDSAVIQVSAMTILSWSISILVSAVTAAAELRQGLLLNQTVLQGRKVKYQHRFCLCYAPSSWPGDAALPPLPCSRVWTDPVAAGGIRAGVRPRAAGVPAIQVR